MINFLGKEKGEGHKRLPFAYPPLVLMNFVFVLDIV
jgi:hypothetical protein